ncbi:Histone superfamily protein [Perilla frutescens var. hirtella]|nr:Histone superfamily protein [Perilla frutescens var. hirtella]
MASTPIVSSNSKKGKSKASTVVSKSSRSVLQFPIDRVSRALKEGKYSERVAAGAPVYLASVLQYMASEVLELSGNEAKNDGKSRIGPRHIELAIRNNKELSTLLGDVTILSSGRKIHFHEDLVPKSAGGKNRDISSGSN